MRTARPFTSRPTAISTTTAGRLSVKTSTKRDVDYWGVGGEARFGKGAEPVPDQGGYLLRFAYVGIGGDVRAIDQDNRLNLPLSARRALRHGSHFGRGRACRSLPTMSTTRSPLR